MNPEVMIAMVNSCGVVKDLKQWLKQESWAPVKPEIEARIAVLTAKPSLKWKPKYKVLPSGGLECPKVIYQDPDGTFEAVDQMIANLQKYKADSMARPRS